MEQVKESLLGMGFPPEQVERACEATKNSESVQVALEWILSHPESASGGQVLGGTEIPATASEIVEQGTAASSEGDAHPQQGAEASQDNRPLTPEERQAALERLEAKRQELRRKKEEEEARMEREREIIRRKSGQELVNAKKEWEEQQLKLQVEQKKREKREEQLARQKVRERIERDKRERAAKFGMPTSATDTSSSAAQVSSTPASTTAAPPAHDECAVMVRLTNGQNLQNTFKPTDTLRTVYSWVYNNRTDGSGPFSFTTGFPRKTYSGAALDVTTLQDAECVPKGLLLVTK
ncbi:UBX domain-containing protein 1 [Balamuthia mandrillaris]